MLPPIERVRDGLWSVPVPMPGYGLRYTLDYVLELPDGLAVIDTGWPGGEGWQALTGGLKQIGFGERHVRAVLASHIHTDHYGLAGPLREASGAWIGVHPADDAMIIEGDPEGEVGRRLAAWGVQRRRMGMPAQGPDGGPRERQPRRWQEVQRTRPDVLINDGDVVDLPGWRLRAVWTPGHSPGHLCFHEENMDLLFAGDHVLPKVTPHVAVTSLQRPNPLQDYLSSLAAVAGLAVAEVLPAHEYRFAGLGERAGELIAHHHARLAEIEDRLSERPGATCWEVANRLTWSRPLDSQPATLRRTAARETLSHLVLLREQDRVHSVGEEPELWYSGSAT
jgi:glyoxylase-like metal-dependent hydrolase (beta-lactamase superfamily II)